MRSSSSNNYRFERKWIFNTNYLDLLSKSYKSNFNFKIQHPKRTVNSLYFDDYNQTSVKQNLDATSDKSRYVLFQNKKLSDYIDCKTNRVLSIDDISPLFNKADPAPNLYTNIDTISSGYNRYLIQTINPDKAERQITEVITLTNNSGDIFTFQKGSIGITTLSEVGNIVGDSSTGKLVFDPTDPYSSDYNIKTLKNTFITNNTGTGSQNFGFVTLSANNNNVALVTTQTLFSATANANKGFFANVEFTDSE